MKHALLIIALGIAIIAVSSLVGQLLGAPVGNLVFVGLAVLAFFYERRHARQRRHAEHMRPTRHCPFCEQGTLSMTPGSGVAYQQGRSTVWFYQWKCARCNFWQVADVLGNWLPEQQQQER